MTEKKTSLVKVPERPWKKGKNETYTCFNVTVRVAETQGNVFSDHELESQEDHQISSELSSGGLRQAAYALLTEALRKEALYTVLLKLQDSPTYLELYLKSDSDSKLKMESELGNAIAHYVVQNVNINVIALVRECFENIALTAGAVKPQ